MQALSIQNLLGWGLGLEDYRQMFDLDESLLDKKILDYAPGVTSFNQQLHQQHKQVLTVDPLFEQSFSDLKPFIEKQFNALSDYIMQHQTHFSWDIFATPEALLAHRREHVKHFLADLPIGLREKRYLATDLQNLGDLHFDMVLLSHTLFGEQDENLSHHMQLIQELLNHTEEIRVFPLLNAEGEIAELVGPVSLHLQQADLGVEIREVSYHLQENGNAMMRIWQQACPVAT